MRRVQNAAELSQSAPPERSKRGLMSASPHRLLDGVEFGLFQRLQELGKTPLVADVVIAVAGRDLGLALRDEVLAKAASTAGVSKAVIGRSNSICIAMRTSRLKILPYP